ncbi:DNA polymerase delta subunit 4-like isoform X2 [Carex rostrata]
MSSGDIKGFYRQKKKGGVTKPSTTTSSKKSNSAQTPALVSRSGAIDLKDEYGEEEEVLRQFDMDMKYGPCIGIDRLDRWERAAAMGLHPPPHVRDLISAQSFVASGKAVSRVYYPCSI